MISKLFQIFLVLTLGLLFAFFFSVPVRKINCFYGKNIPFLKHRKKIRNILSVITWYGLILFFLLLICILLYYNVRQYFSFITWNDFVHSIANTVNPVLDLFPFVNGIGFQSISSKIIKSIMKLPGIIGKIIISFLISIYLLIDWDYYRKSIRKWKKDYLNSKVNRFLSVITRRTKDMLFGYVKGQSLDALVMGVLLSVGLWLIGVPFAIPIGIFAGIGNMIPYVGPVIAFVFTILFCLIEQRIRTLVFALIYLVLIQQLDSSLIGPKLLGKQMQIRPLFVIVSILIGGTLFGITGMIFAVPAAAVFKVLLKEWADYRKNFINGNK